MENEDVMDTSSIRSDLLSIAEVLTNCAEMTFTAR
jgi:hypothetical protein